MTTTMTPEILTTQQISDNPGLSVVLADFQKRYGFALPVAETRSPYFNLAVNIARAAAPIRSRNEANCFGFMVTRNGVPDEIDLVIEITDYQPFDRREYNECGQSGSIEIEAFTQDGKSFTLTELEHERAVEQALEHITR